MPLKSYPTGILLKSIKVVSREHLMNLWKRIHNIVACDGKRLESIIYERFFLRKLILSSQRTVFPKGNKLPLQGRRQCIGPKSVTVPRDSKLDLISVL